MDRQRGATLVESLIAIMLSGLVVVGIVTAMRTGVRSSRSASEHASLESGLADAAQLLERAPYVRCPFLDPGQQYQALLASATTRAGFRVSRIDMSITYAAAGEREWTKATTTTTLPPLPTTTTNPIVTSTVPVVTFSPVTTTTTLAATTTTTGAAATTTTLFVTPTAPPTTDPTATTTTIVETTTTEFIEIITTTTRPPIIDAGGLDSDALERLTTPIAGLRTGLIRADVCTAANATSNQGPVQIITLTARSNNGIEKELVVVKSDD